MVMAQMVHTPQRLIVPCFVMVVVMLFGMICGIVLCSCSAIVVIKPIKQRIVVLRDNTLLYKLNNGQRTQIYLGSVQRGDTLESFAEAITSTESGDRQLFFVYVDSGLVMQSIVHTEAWLDAEFDAKRSVPFLPQAGARACSEYEAVASNCDTEFVLPNTLDSLAWERAQTFVQANTDDFILHTSPTLIRTTYRYNNRSRTESATRSTQFIIKRKFQGATTLYSIRVNEPLKDPLKNSLTDCTTNFITASTACKCALFIQTGKDERDFQDRSYQAREYRSE
jgi:hypothetical protein